MRSSMYIHKCMNNKVINNTTNYTNKSYKFNSLLIPRSFNNYTYSYSNKTRHK